MAFDYITTARDAAALLAEFGAPVTLTRITPGVYDPATGTVVNSGATHVASGVKLDYEQRAIDGTNILQGDQRVYLDPLIATAPQAGDTLTIGTEVFTVVASRPLSPAGVVVLHDIQVRRA